MSNPENQYWVTNPYEDLFDEHLNNQNQLNNELQWGYQQKIFCFDHHQHDDHEHDDDQHDDHDDHDLFSKMINEND